MLALVTLAAGIVGTIALQTPGGRPSLSPAGDGSLVVEEEVGLFGRLLGREPRLFVTVPTGTTLSLEMRSPVSSATARSGDAITAEVLEPVAVEGQEAIGRGSQVVGRVAQVEPAKAAGGRGHLALRFDAVVLTDGARVRLHADPVELVAPPPRPTKNPKGGFAGAWAKVTSTVGEIVRDVRREVETGGVSGAQAAEREGGLDIEVPSGSTLSVQLTRTVTITRTRDR